MIQDGTFSNMTISSGFKLNLEGNPIKQLGKYSFSNIISSSLSLYTFQMNFKSMQLEKIHELAFHNVDDRRFTCHTCEFIFNDNLLETIPSNLCDLSERYDGFQVYLYLDNNPWSCDCRMREVFKCSGLIRHLSDFTCRYPPALNNRMLLSVTDELVCFSPAIDYISSTVYQAAVGETVILYCNATGFNRPTLTWHPGETPSDRQHHEVSTANLDYNSTESTLTITNVQMSDQGSYTCQASNAAGVDSRSLSLTVIQGTSRVAAAIGGTVGAVVLCIILGLIYMYFMHKIKRRQNKNNASNRPSTQTTQQSTMRFNPEFEEDETEYDDVRIAEPRGPATIEIHHGRPVIGSAENQVTTAVQGAASAEGAGHLYQGLVHENPDHVYTSLQDGANASGGRDERAVGDGGRSGQEERLQHGPQAQAGQTAEGTGGGATGHVYQSLRQETPDHVYTSLRGEEATPGDANGRQDIANADHGYQNPGDITAELPAEEPHEEPIASPQYYNIPGDDYHDYLSLRDD
ncbi:PREDICTED: leucine-rich repeat and immunoglobulin-like domain-containing nogo receptor-interacting protein 3 [Branchiostoma belcheri]|uniref:Leucine-rich repeat and immunoglobulin-like domain-containing nogo receptor-interacting protein 3 n=1 Tax=Branchiostoma belcheri TaxID=7741 RepID=A0A6P4ZHY5_BRABE|nr:PREDICTED: leucine-rich repeat and immunoglobulin-like domain-containing nogo receptor-interacting protein 3 [Branchiostoma belcheri]